ncbi:nuclear transport factor 2 family protein [Sphingomonas flavalba]|uniref:nuclear transport factor 2 family protein n=1 Tax=Sphingomonas flavalba TaxID=2559804 RepID=UPI00109DCA5A|nr:nuclear transport factor 2 family protein [Sphingomonas flavalba]
MTSPQDSADVVRRFFTAFGAGDMDGAFAMLAPDITWTYYGPEDRIPFAGAFRGHDGVRQFFARAAETIRIKEMTPSALVGIAGGAADGSVLGRGVEHSVSLATGREYRVEWVHVYRVKDGLMTSFEEFLDTAAVVDALGS